MMDRARYLRDNGWGMAARDLAARPHNFTYRPADPERFYDMLLLLANDAVQDRQWKTAYNIASQLDDVLPPGATVDDQSLGVRDNYTSLAFLAGNVALDRLGQPANAMAMYDRYSQAGRSLQVLTKGAYWAGRAALSAGRIQEANSYFQRAAAYPELFYGQLALERLGRSVTPPPTALPQMTTTTLQRAAFNSRRLVQGVRAISRYGDAQERSLFAQALAQSLESDQDRNMAVDFAQQIGRSDIPVWVARIARIKGSAFYVRQAYPMLPTSVSPSLWSLAHGITRQESSFDQYAVSHAGARGMMQLMTGTAREQAGKMGMGYDSGRLTSDPSYNVALGSAYFQRMLNIWNGSVPLAVASYNAGSGNVGKWVRTYGDPRGQVDMLKWIEAIPYTETKGYVQRVIENSVVYDSMRSAAQPQTAMHVSRFLGKTGPG
jgi:soluble lytic murein transglycosylase